MVFAGGGEGGGGGGCGRSPKFGMMEVGHYFCGWMRSRPGKVTWLWGDISKSIGEGMNIGIGLLLMLMQC